MSYELYLLRVPPGQQARAVLDRHFQSQEAELNPGPSDPAKETEKRRLATALMQFDPGLSIAAFDFANMAALEGIDENEARRRYRHLELNSDDYSGIQITVWDDAAEISFPYWHSGEQAERVLLRVWDYLEVLEQSGKLTVYDPQLAQSLALGFDFQTALQHYARGGSR